jgi:HlyD family secretion protein
MALSSIMTLFSEADLPIESMVARPARRWKSRVLLPCAILVTTAAIFGYSAKSAWLPATEVWVTPVVAAPRPKIPQQQAPLLSNDAGGPKVRGTLLVQAPGWIEPAPYATSVPALVEGVVKEILVLEGDRVKEGQSVVQLVDEDAQLDVKAAEAELAALQAEVKKIRAEVRAAESRVAEVDDQLARARQLAPAGGVPQEKVSQLGIRSETVRAEVDALQAEVEVGLSGVRKQEVKYEIAKLALHRTRIVSPHDGVVLSRLVEPGTRITMNGGGASEAMSGTVLRLYDPAQLQVRVDVPLADFGKLRVGTPAEVVTDALPDVVLDGVLTRVVHEANVQRNSVPVKVAIINPSEVLKPEMLARVRFYESQGDSFSSRATNTDEQVTGESFRLLLPEAAISAGKNQEKIVWIVKYEARRSGMVAVQQDVKIAPCNVPGYAEVLTGLQPGDRIVIEPPANLKQGEQVRVLGEKPIHVNGSENRS